MIATLIAVVVGLSFATGAFLLMSGSLWRRILGMGAFGNGINVYLVSTGFLPYLHQELSPEGVSTESLALSRPAFLIGSDIKLPATVSDPVSQALVLTAIVIGFAVIAILLSLFLIESMKLKTARGSAGTEPTDESKGAV